LDQLALAQLPGHLGGLALRPDLHPGRLVLHPGGPGPGPRLHVGPGGEFFRGLAEMITGAFDLLLNFRCGHRRFLPQNFPWISSTSALTTALPAMSAAAGQLRSRWWR